MCRLILHWLINFLVPALQSLPPSPDAASPAERPSPLNRRSRTIPDSLKALTGKPRKSRHLSWALTFNFAGFHDFQSPDPSSFSLFQWETGWGNSLVSLLAFVFLSSKSPQLWKIKFLYKQLFALVRVENNRVQPAYKLMYLFLSCL